MPPFPDPGRVDTDNSREFVETVSRPTMDSRYDNKKEQQERWFKVAFTRNGGTVRSCFVRNVHNKMTDGKTAYENIIGVTFDGPFIPFGA